MTVSWTRPTPFPQRRGATSPLGMSRIFWEVLKQKLGGKARFWGRVTGTDPPPPGPWRSAAAGRTAGSGLCSPPAARPCRERDLPGHPRPRAGRCAAAERQSGFGAQNVGARVLAGRAPHRHSLPAVGAAGRAPSDRTSRKSHLRWRPRTKNTAGIPFGAAPAGRRRAAQPGQRRRGGRGAAAPTLPLLPARRRGALPALWNGKC